jgi:hypothetical protein
VPKFLTTFFYEKSYILILTKTGWATTYPMYGRNFHKLVLLSWQATDGQTPYIIHCQQFLILQMLQYTFLFSPGLPDFSRYKIPKVPSGNPERKRFPKVPFLEQLFLDRNDGEEGGHSGRRVVKGGKTSFGWFFNAYITIHFPLSLAAVIDKFYSH